ncbi:MAG: hypothetical protein AB7S36_13385, partial [Planctomycetota bacterium]
MVFAALTALFMISLPFVRSMHQARETARNYEAWLQARQDAQSVRSLGFAWLHRAHPFAQAEMARTGNPVWIRDAVNNQMMPLDSPDYDSPWEFDAQRALEMMLLSDAGLRSEPRPVLDVANAHGRLWTSRVTDEQGKINADSATPWLLGNLMGGTLLTQEIKADATSIFVEDGSWLDPENGYIWIDGELIAYKTCTHTGSNWTLGNCQRGLGSSQSAPLPDQSDLGALGLQWQPSPSHFEYRPPQVHTIWSPVVPGVAYKVARCKIEPILQLYTVQAMGLNASTPVPPATINWFKDVDTIRMVADYRKFDGGRAESIAPFLWSDLVRDRVTIYSAGQAPLNFVRPHILARNIGLTPVGAEMPATGSQTVIDVTDNTGINAGSILRLRSDGDQAQGIPPVMEYLMAVAVKDNRIVVDRMPRNRFLQNHAIVEVLDRHPININTASREVLTAVLQGLRINTTDAVSAAEARKVADFIVLRVNDPAGFQPFVDAADFTNFISQNYSGWGLSAVDAQAIVLNATANHDRRLLSPTAPFCYRSFSTYTVESVGMKCAEPLGGGPGIPLAQYAIRDIVTIGAPGLLGLFDQRELPALMDDRNRGYGNGLVIGTRGTLNGRVMGKIELPVKPSGQAGNNNAADVFYVDYGGLGRNWAGSPFRLDTQQGNGTNGRSLGINDGNGRIDLRAGFLGFWIKLDNVDGNTTYFDLSESTFSNRFSLVFDPRRRALVLRVADAGLDHAFMELVFPAEPNGSGSPAFRDGNWYHFIATWKGTPFQQLVAGEHIPMRMSLVIDGMGCTPKNRTEGHTTATYIDNNGNPIEVSTELQNDLPWGQNPIDPSQPPNPWYEVVVVDASNLPAAGIIDVSGEAIEYTVKSGNRLTGTLVPELDPLGNPTGRQIMTGFSRRARGTPRPPTNVPHIAGTPVHPYGYSAFLQREPNGFANTLPATSGNNMQDVGTTTGPLAAGAVNPDDDGNYTNPLAHGPRAGLPSSDVAYAGGGNATEGLELRVTPGTTDDFPQRGYLLVQGNAITAYADDGTGKLMASPPPQPAWEIIYYDGKDTTDTVHAKNSAITYHRFLNLQRNAIPLADASAPAVPNGGHHFANDGNLRIALISWQTSSTNGYNAPTGYVMNKESREVIQYNQFGPGGTGSYFIYNPPDCNAFFSAGNNPLRGQLGTARSPASSGTVSPMLPVFWIAGKAAYQRPVGFGDPITVISGRNGNKVNQDIAGNLPLIVFWERGAGNNQWVTLSDHVATTYDPAVPGTRLLRFPSGELPLNLPPQVSFGGPTPGGAAGATTNGMIDEVEWQGLGAGDFRLVGALPAYSNGQPVSRIQVNAVSSQINREVGVVRIDDELVAYRGVQEVQRTLPNGTVITEYFLIDCERGFLGTPIGNHDHRTLYLNVANARIAKLASTLPQNGGGTFQIAGENPGFPLDNVGFGLAGTDKFNMELVGYRRTGNLFRVSDYRPEGRGLFRGSYGTPIINHGGGRFVPLVMGQPYRYIDRYCDPDVRGNNPQGRMTINTPEQFTVSGAAAAPQARWLRVHWQMANDPRFADIEGQHIEMQLLVKPTTVASW